MAMIVRLPPFSFTLSQINAKAELITFAAWSVIIFRTSSSDSAEAMASEASASPDSRSAEARSFSSSFCCSVRRSRMSYWRSRLRSDVRTELTSVLT